MADSGGGARVVHRAPVGLDTTIARLVVLTDAVCHAVDLVEVVAEQFVPVAVEGNDDWVCYASRLVCCIVC